ncbi:MAG TPA: GNAT family N-acetyltransferase [Solirubrobacteraceae bacterium]|nr:GNAT family N-acetyltransferase [Solirubrobacteraceae bacterium]
MNLSVRAASPDDVPEIVRINIDSWRAAYSGLISDRYLQELDRTAREHTWRQRLAGDPTMPTFVALGGEQVIGYCAVSAPSRDEDAPPDVAEIAAIYIDPRHWRAGAGAALMEAALRWIRDQGSWRMVTLWVLAENDRAQQFYRRFGFAPDGARHHLLDLRADEIRMSLAL